MCPFKAYLQCDFYEIKHITSCQCELEHQNKKNIGLLIISCLLPEVKILKITNGLEPTHVADGVELVPEELLKLIRCACKSQIPCKDNRCSCRHASMTCTVFCGCNESCQNAPISQNDCDDHSDDEN